MVLEAMPVCSAIMRVADVAIGTHLAAPGTRDVVSDIGRKRGLAHAGTPGNDDQIRRLQAAHPGVEIREPGGEAGQLALALVRACGHVDRGRERRLELLESTAIPTDLGQIIQPTLGILDLIAGRKIHRRIERDIDHVLADLDEIAPDREVIDRAAVVHRVNDGCCLGRKPGQILAQRQSRYVEVGGQEGL